ncbi:MAG: hypothetical protein QNJ88_02050 [Acidimicrobiia bacterium]|nr:hypothetical protein [Acidimicrobiia bacterium]
MHLPPAATIRRRSRTISLAVALWLFGLSTTILLIGLWGRSVAADEVTLESSARAVLESELVNDRMTDWISDAIASATDVAPDEIADVVAAVAASDEFSGVMEDLVDQLVAAALGPPGAQVTVDLTGSVDEMLPVVLAALADRGVNVDRELIRNDAAEIQDVILGTDRDPAGTGAARSAEHVLTWVFVIGLAGVVTSGLVTLALAEDRLRQARALAIRLGVSAITFAVILRVGAWAVDPGGGRSPIRAGGSRLLGSNGHVPLLVAVAAAAVVGIATFVLIRRRRELRLATQNTKETNVDSELVPA